MRISLLLADDEESAQKELMRIISKCNDFEVVDIVSNGQEALDKIKTLKVEAAFLDIDMPLLTGLEVASELSRYPNPPKVVFATAFNQYAIDAFDRNATDYVLKPYQEERIFKALDKIKEALSSQNNIKKDLVSLEEDLISAGLLSRIAGRKRNSKDRIVMDPSEIDYFQAEHSEIFAIYKGEKVIVDFTLKDLLASLGEDSFAQVHKSYIVNLSSVSKISPLFHGNFELTLKDSSLPHIPLSRRFSKSFKSRLGSV